MARRQSPVMPITIVFLLISISFAKTVQLSMSRSSTTSTRLFSLGHRPWASKLSTFQRKAPNSLLNTTHSRSQLPAQPVFGNVVPLGEYFVTLTFGGQPINVQVDTGSSTIAVPLKSCQNCRQNDHRFDPKKARGKSGFISCSSSYCAARSCSLFRECTQCSAKTQACCSTEAPSACGFFLTYADQSGAYGALMEADVGIEDLKVAQVFGGILSETAQFESAAVDGIFGLAYWPLACNPTCVQPLFDTLVKQGLVEKDVFSLCTLPTGGTLTLGGSNKDHYEGELQYVPMKHKGTPMYYDVAVKGVTIGGKQLAISEFTDAIVDSGTTVLVMTPKAYNDVQRFFQANYCQVPGLCPQSTQRHRTIIRIPGTIAAQLTVSQAEQPTWFTPGYCVKLSDREIAMLPTIEIVLDNNVKLTLEPDLYMLKYEVPSSFGLQSNLFRCLGFTYLEGMDGLGNNVIIGNTVLQKYFVEYDRQNDRVGFAIAKNCIDPNAKLLKGESLPTSEGGWLPDWVMTALTIFAVLGWVIVILVCITDFRRRQRDRQGYNVIDEGHH